MDAMATKHEEFRHMEAIVRSVLDSAAADRLAAYTSMHDLIVVDVPIPEPPYGVVAVRAPGSLHPPRDGHVLICPDPRDLDNAAVRSVPTHR
jgi:hypothetical protein